MTKEQRVSETKRIYKFGKDAQGNNVTEGSAQDKYILGGKGANLAEMAKIGPVSYTHLTLPTTSRG